jgi:hypothetical protein
LFTFVDIGGIVDHRSPIPPISTKVNNRLSPKESLNNDDQQFHQYQQK